MPLNGLLSIRIDDVVLWNGRFGWHFGNFEFRVWKLLASMQSHIWKINNAYILLGNMATGTTADVPMFEVVISAEICGFMQTPSENSPATLTLRENANQGWFECESWP